MQHENDDMIAPAVPVGDGSCNMSFQPIGVLEVVNHLFSYGVAAYEVDEVGAVVHSSLGRWLLFQCAVVLCRARAQAGDQLFGFGAALGAKI